MTTHTHPPQRTGNISRLGFLSEGIYNSEIMMPWTYTLIRVMGNTCKEVKEKYDEYTKLAAKKEKKE